MPSKKSAPRRKRAKASPLALSAELASVSKALAASAGGKKRTRPKEKNKLRSRYNKLRVRLNHESEKLEQLAAKAAIIAPPTALPNSGLRRMAMARGGPAAAPKDKDEDTVKNIGPQFRNFLSQVGAAMVDAQKQLDEETRRYLNGTVPAALPSMFRLPRLNAKVQFDFADEKKKELNFIFYKDGGTTKESGQHTLDFEIVAVPPPPGFNPPVPAWRLLTGSEREDVLTTITTGDPALKTTIGPGEGALLWELTTPSGALMALLINAPKGDLGKVDLFLIGPTRRQCLQAQTIQAATDAATSQIVAGLHDLADKQAAAVG